MSPDQPNPAVKQTLEYIDAIKRRLRITVENGEPITLIDRIDRRVLGQLRADLGDILEQDEEARNAVARGDGALLQTVAFGEATDLDLLVRTGYTLGNRVVLWDYLHRVLAHRTGVDRERDAATIAAIANSIVALEGLAKEGHVIVLGHPLDWSKDASRAIQQVAKDHSVTPDLMALVSTLAASSTLGLHPYTIGNSAFYRSVSQTPAANAIASASDHRSLVRGLLAARVLTDKRFAYLQDVPLDSFREVIAEQEDFYRQFSDRLSAATPQDGEYRLRTLSAELDKLINSRNAAVQKAAEEWALHGSTLAATIGLVVASLSPDPVLRVAGALTSLTVALAKTVQPSSGKGGTLVTVFRRLKRTSREYSDAFEAAVSQSSHPADEAEILLRGFPRNVAVEVARAADPGVVAEILNTHGDYAFQYLDVLHSLDSDIFWMHVLTGLAFTSDVVNLIGYLTSMVENDTKLRTDVLHALLHRVLVEASDGELEMLDSDKLLRGLMNSRRHGPRTRVRIRRWFDTLSAAERESATIRLRALVGADAVHSVTNRQPLTRAVSRTPRQKTPRQRKAVAQRSGRGEP
jgi:hypothetical protein